MTPHDPPYAHTADWADDDVAELVNVAAELEAQPLHLAGCWMSESGLRTTAHNPNGDAVGLFQLMPATARGLGWFQGWQAFAALSVRDQLGWALRYYGHHKGLLVSPGACYLATFLPAFMPHAGDPTYVLCKLGGPHAEWYAANKGLDVNNDGVITVQDLTDRIARVTVGPRWDEFAARVNKAAITEPEIQVPEEIRDVPVTLNDDAPVFVLPDEDEPTRDV